MKKNQYIQPTIVVMTIENNYSLLSGSNEPTGITIDGTDTGVTSGGDDTDGTSANGKENSLWE